MSVKSITQTTLTCGANTVASNSLKGGVCDLRLTIGAARYSGNFTPPPIGSLVETSSVLLPGTADTSIAGQNYKKNNGNPVETVVIIDWGTYTYMGSATPDNDGNWSVAVPPGEYGVIALSSGCRPHCDGPYTVT